MSHHHHHNHDECCHEEDNHCCCSHDECCEHEHHGEQDFAHQLLELADDAWMELLKEKIKKQIESTGGAQLDKLAKLVNTVNKDRWQHKMAKHNVLEGYRDKLAEFFHKK